VELGLGGGTCGMFPRVSGCELDVELVAVTADRMQFRRDVVVLRVR
jgi:hypothetical protein